MRTTRQSIVTLIVIWSTLLGIASGGDAPPTLPGVGETLGPRPQSRQPGVVLPATGQPFALLGDFGLSDRQKVYLIPEEGAKRESLAATVRDVQVMRRILSHVLTQPRWVGGVFYDYGSFFQEDGDSIQAIYIQGFAALFFVEVDFPLVRAPKAEQERRPTPTEEGAVDPVWRSDHRAHRRPGGRV